MEIVHLKKSLVRCKEMHDFWGLTFYGENGLSLKDLAREAKLPYTYLRVSTIGLLKAAGFEPQRTFTWPHLSLIWEDMPADSELERLEPLFDQPIENPHPYQ